jgi:hypothetical protein
VFRDRGCKQKPSQEQHDDVAGERTHERAGRYGGILKRAHIREPEQIEEPCELVRETAVAREEKDFQPQLHSMNINAI